MTLADGRIFPVIFRPMLVVHVLLVELYNNVAILSLAPTVIPDPFAALAVLAVLANCIVLASVIMLPISIILPVTVRLPSTVKLLNVISLDMSRYWA